MSTEPRDFTRRDPDPLRSSSAATHALLDRLAGFQLRRAQLRVSHDFAARFASRSVTPGQLGLLLLIRARPGISQSALAHRVGIERSTLGEFVDRFDEHGLVDRRPSPDDRRSHALHLTPKGEEDVEALLPEVERHEEAVLAPLSPTERRTLVELLARIADAPA